jgi:S-adenosylmethionine synthetase
MRRFADERKSGRIPWLRPDAKSQVSVVYEDGRPVRIAAVVLSHQTTDEPDIDRDIRPAIEAVVRDELADTGMLDPATKFHVNPTGRFVVGGPAGDSGLTGRKIVVDTYGGACPHGGGAFSGKDPSKVDRSAAYYARYAAKNLVAAGAADRCEIQVSYAIGVAAPTSVRVQFFGTEKGGATEEKAVAMLESGEVFDFRPGRLVAALGLLAPRGWTYRDTASGGHFGRAAFPWERTDRAGAVRAALGLK